MQYIPSHNASVPRRFQPPHPILSAVLFSKSPAQGVRTKPSQDVRSLMLSIAKGLLETETKEKEEERKRYMTDTCPPLSLPGGLQALQIEDLKIKVQDLKGKFKKPALRKVRMSADQMLQALLGSKHKVSLDLRANLKQVKKEVKEEDKELRDVGDWRKNVEDKAGMDGRKKMFESEA
ncbi:troponin I, fast skeletal muscle-like isoform X3 [Electrophorus electricus]|uniref:troponin I, fast skeletal muscle-like isoform X3 n=1 Tax=Electrophorus electricus TaxID=8005 RepID=UPI0015CFD544|nr:troponin I, fast skeletal muscle-like isoform X3 [Electrophorus electricus]